MIKRMGKKAAYASLARLPYLLFFAVISSASAQGVCITAQTMIKRMGKKAAYASLARLPYLLFFAVISSASAQGVATPSDTDNRADAVAENSPIGAAVGITAQAAGSTNYTLIDSAGGLFAINPQSGIVTVADALDHEAFSSHSITVQASDAISSQTISFVIRVTDVPEPLGPVIDIDISPDKIVSGAMRGDPVGITARAADPDRGTAVSYSLSEDSTGRFTINPQNGVVTLASDNYDPDQDYLIEVTAVSSDDTSTSSVAQFAVRRDEQLVRIAPTSAILTVREGESQDIAFSSVGVYLEAVSISAGEFHSCAVVADNEAVCWGSDANPAGMRTGKVMPPSGGKFIAVSVGDLHSCGITVGNEAVCWGDDSFGQRAAPSGRFIAISAGNFHTCGITAGNEAVCWGAEEGDGRTMPTTGREFIAVSAGERHSCGVTVANDAICWGDGTDGQSEPPSDRKFVVISAGNSHSCGITLAKDAICWGDNDLPRLLMPPPGKKFIALDAGGFHTCGITAANEAVCWGDDSFGESSPPPGKKFIAASAGWSHTCGITAANEAVCWGSDENDNNELTGQSSPPQITPIAAHPITITATVSAADREQLSLSDNGRAVIPAGETRATLSVRVSDDNIAETETSHIIGLSVEGRATLERDEITVIVPVDARDPGDIDGADNEVAENSPIGAEVGIVAQVENAATYTLVDSAGGLFAINPQSGTVTVAMDMLDFEAFSSHSITVQTDNNVNLILIIRLTDEPEPIGPVADIDFNPDRISHSSSRGDTVGITARAADPDRGGIVSYRLSEDASGLFAIGQRDGIVTLTSGNYDPERDYLIEVTAESDDSTLSTAQFTVRADEPIRIASSPTAFALREGESRDVAFSLTEIDLKVKNISAGKNHSCAITPDNEAVCWGSDTGPEGMRSGQSEPPSGERFIAVSAGGYHSCAITPANDAVCWGSNADGRAAPTTGKRFIAVSSGDRHNCAITPANDAVCWGDNNRDQTLSPADKKFIAISAGGSHTCGITPANDAACWGDNTEGQSEPPSNRKFIAISAGNSHSCAVTLDNKAVCWGDNDSGQTAPPADTKFIAISVGNSHSCAVTFANDAVCWGDNNSGQTMPPAGTKFIAISSGDFHSCGITAGNEAVCWGSSVNILGQSVGQNLAPQAVIPAAADSIAVIAMISDADRGQITFSDNAQAVIPAGEKQATLTVTAGDDDIIEPQADYTISLSAAGHTELEPDKLIITVPVDDSDTQAIGNLDSATAAADGAVAENSPAGAEVGIIAHAANTTGYNLIEDADGRFAIDNNGLVTVADGGKLDFEDAATHSITIQAANADRSTIQLTVQVINVNEIALKDRDGRDNLARASTGAVARGVTLEAVHSDGILIISWELRQDADLFELTRPDSGSSQRLRIKADAENLSARINTAISLSVIVRTDHDVATETFTISLTEREPVLTGELGDSDDTDNEVAENSPAGAPVGITAYAGAATAAYTLSDDADGRFAISSTGLVTVADGGKLNFEDAATHSIIIRAGGINAAAAQFIIQVINADEIALRDRDRRNNLARAAAGAAVLGITLEAVHDDGAPVAAWGLRQDADLFELTQPDSGSTQGLRIASDAQSLSARINTTVSLSVIARTDHDVTTEAFTIGFTEGEPLLVGALEDIDDAADEVAENSPANTPVGIIIRADNAAAYALSDDAGGRFAISSETGLVTVADGGRLNFEEAVSHTITVEASSINDSLAMPFIVNVTDVNEFAVGPLADSDRDTDNELPENASAGSYAGITLSATDEDGSAIVAYMLLDSDNGLFAADTMTGIVTLRGSLNFERSTRHAIVGRAMSNDASVSTRLFTVRVGNVNEIALRDRDRRNNLARAAAGAAVLGITLEAVHDDGAPVAAWGLRQDADLFELTQPDSGSTQGLRIASDAQSLSARINTTVSLSVIARTDHDVTTEAFTIGFTEGEPLLVGALEDIDDAADEVAENSPANTPVGIIIRADNAAAYALSDDAGGRFAISSETGLVTVADGGRLNFEEAVSHTITVEASSINDSLAMPFIVNVTDVNEFAVGPLADSDRDTDNELPENASAGSYAGITLSATDEDGSAIVAYMLLDSDNGLFAADTMTGIVTLRGSLNFERSTRHAIVGRAMSNDASVSTRLFTVRVGNVNELVLSDEDSRSEVASTKVGAVVSGIDLRANHPDGAPIIGWRLNEAGGALFALTRPQTGGTQSLVVHADDAEPQTMEVIVSARTEHDAASITFTVRLVSFEFDEIGGEFRDADDRDNEVEENAATGTEVGVTMVLDNADRYGLSDNADGRFAISSEAGVVTVADGGKLDYEENAMHHITVTAFTEGDVQSNSTRVAINVIDVDEEPERGIRLRLRVYLEGALE